MKRVLMVLAALVLAGALFAETGTAAAPAKATAVEASSQGTAPAKAKKAVKKTKKAKKQSSSEAAK